MRILSFSRSLKNLLLTSVLVMAVQSAEAANRFVDGDSGSDSGNNCTSAGSPCASVSRAIDVAVGGDTIRIADAVYTEILQVDKALTFSGASRAGTIIQAAANRGDAADRTMTIAEDVPVQLSDLTIRHGNTGLNGGGLRSFGGDLLIERVTFVDNDAGGLGAALNSGENVIVMNDVVFRDNGNSDTSEGGGARLGENQQPTDVTLNNVTFENNAAGGSGGGLRLFRARAVLRNVAFIGNTSIQTNGGGLSYVGGGGITASTLELRDSVFIGNSAADGSGGGMDTTFETPYTMVNVLFSGNLANLGGGIFNQGNIDGTRVLTNVTMTGNRATLRGGAIDKPLDMTFRNTVIWNNADSLGTGTAEATMDDFFNDSVVEVSNSLLQGYAADAFPGSGNLDGTLPGNNPLFISTVNPTGAPSLGGDLRLQRTSPVRDQGNNSFVAGVATDLDGEDRIFNGIVDLGPYEGTDVLFADGFEDSLF